MEFYTPSGEKIKRVTKKMKDLHYYSTAGDLRAVPSMTSERGEAIEFLLACMKVNDPHISVEVVEEVWDEYEEKKNVVLSYLDVLSLQSRMKEDYFRVRAYNNAIKAIKRLNVPIASGKQALKVKGIGKSIATKIDEILNTGKLASVDEGEYNRLSERSKTLELLLGIWGVGPKMAGRLYDMGVRTLEHARISGLLGEKELIGLKYYDDFKKRIPRDEVKEMGDIVCKIVHEMDADANCCVCGSYRRGLSSSGDIDILISTSTTDLSDAAFLRNLISQLERSGHITDNLSLGPKKYMGVAKIRDVHRRIDIRILPREKWGAGILYFTGSKSFNTMMRTEAIKKGMRLSEYGLVYIESGELVPTYAEEDIFGALGMEYVPPEKRV